jgi:hypothetical protein
MIPSRRVPHPTRLGGPRTMDGERFLGLPIVARSVASFPRSRAVTIDDPHGADVRWH